MDVQGVQPVDQSDPEEGVARQGEEQEENVHGR